jgi:hypothetical protein
MRVLVLIAGALASSLGPSGALPPAAPAPDLPRSALAIFADGEWRAWWRSDSAPPRWSGALPLVADAVVWHLASNEGLEWGELRLSGAGEAWRLRVILARIDPRRFELRLENAADARKLAGAWTVDDAQDDAVLAVNAGQFAGGTPWGWIVRRGEEMQPPGSGPLSMAVSVDSAGMVQFTPTDSLAAWPAAERQRAVEAFQSYPSLLVGDGEVPAPLLDAGRGIDVAHRDTRLALGELRDGRLLIALTRFDGLGGVLSVVPFGPTVPEMAAVMGALGCRRAVMLDGGISGQLMVRDEEGEPRAWRGLRKVPLGLVVIPRG